LSAEGVIALAVGYATVAFKTLFSTYGVYVFYRCLMTADTVALDNPSAPRLCDDHHRLIKGVFVNIYGPGVGFVDKRFRDIILWNMAVPAVDAHVLAMEIVQERCIIRVHDMTISTAVLVG